VKRRVFLILLRISFFLLLIITVARFTLRDTHFSSALLFYMFPLPVLTGCFALNGFLLMRCGTKQFHRLAMTGGTACFCLWFYPVIFHSVPGLPQKTFTLLFWNMAHPKHPFRPLIDTIRAEKPDVVALVETAQISTQAVQDYAKELPEYRLVVLPKGMAAFCKGPIEITQTNLLPNSSGTALLQCHLPSGRVPLLIVDIGANPTYPREPRLAEVLATAGSETNVIIAGDFNTPFDSAFFDPYHLRFSHALKAAGNGTLETWPVGLPVLALDHVWLSRKFIPIRARKQWSLHSDHAKVLVDVAVRP
jgi:endonuclease/exonuclease/phosphatase (EEP) superfamily protein YafD